jgi:mycofactocin precursor
MTQPITEPAEPAEPPQSDVQPPAAEALVEDELLVEDVSIDGMCGVY